MLWTLMTLIGTWFCIRFFLTGTIFRGVCPSPFVFCGVKGASRTYEQIVRRIGTPVRWSWNVPAVLCAAPRMEATVWRHQIRECMALYGKPFNVCTCSYGNCDSRLRAINIYFFLNHL